MTMAWWAAALMGIAGVGIGYVVRFYLGSYKGKGTEAAAKRLLDQAKQETEETRKEAKLQAKAEVLKAREEFEKSTDSRRQELKAAEERAAQREGNLDRKVSMLDKKERAIDQKLAEVEKQSAEIGAARADLDRLIKQEQEQLQRVAGMTQEEAKQTLFARLEGEMRGEVGGLIRRLQEQAKETAEREAQKIVAQAVQRYASGHASEIMTSTVALPSDDMKGRIIGRDGRNVRTLEAVTGVSLLIDDTPEAVVISGFDPVRREVARQTLERLIQDGRIHPARIEELAAKVREEMDETIRAAGEEAAYKLGLQGVNPELQTMIGRLKFRSSYSQNVLMHSMEVAHLMGMMAGDLGLDVTLAKRIGLLHDIGKAMDHEVEGGHAIIGADFLKKHSESQVLVNAAASHHEEVAPESIYAVLTAAADAISGSRPGARSETTEIYLKRLEKLEGIANSFKGVEKSYAIQAGREIRVLVQPEEISDNEAMVLARNISKKIESELQYPGQIRVTVIRETRHVEYAR
jgi:ribonuclease Y